MKIKLDEHIKEYIDISLKLTSEKNYDQLFESVLRDAMDLTNCDAGTVYRMMPDSLKFMVMRNDSLRTYQGGHGEKVDLPDVPLKEENICAYSAIHREVFNIPDVYYSDLFDFNGPKNFDAITGYRTQSMLVLPLISHEDEVLGVMQLMNAMDEDGTVVPFTLGDEYVVRSIASQSSVSMANMIHINDMKDLLDSAVMAFMTTQLVKTPYDAGHSANVAYYISTFARFVNDLYEKGGSDIYFPDSEIEMLRMAGLLHDIGKLALDKNILEKHGRLMDGDLERILTRLDLIDAYMEIKLLSGQITAKQYNDSESYIISMGNTILTVNTTDVLDKHYVRLINDMAKKSYTTLTGKVIPYLTETEYTALISSDGVLSSDELKMQQSHVILGVRILNNIRFGKRYKDVPEYIAKHHEYLDGSGYPEGLKGDEIPMGARLITLVNEYDNLTATDRPYRKPKTPQEAETVLLEMVANGKLDSELVDLFCAYLAQK